jgi:osmotically-inducible protein OsmY
VTSYNRRVLLTGEVPDEATKAEVERQVMDIEGVQGVVNELAVAGAASFASRSNDALITGKVKASLVDAKDISANNFKVTTERGIVYLMGRVTQREGSRGAEVARGVSGVTQVVKVFEYIDPSETTPMSSSAAPDAGAR